MKQKTIALLAIAALMCVVTGCSKSDDTPTRIQEKDLVGIWYDEYEYAGVTEDGIPFSRVLLAVDVAADHTGSIYMGVFNNTEENPLYAYGGPKDAAFKWSLLNDGKVALSTPDDSEDIVLSPSRSGTNGSYGNGMTDVGSTNVTCNGNGMTLTNNNYSGTLTKADASKTSDINDKLRVLIIAVKSGDTGLGFNGYSGNPARAPQF
jgi:hypothetical protein